MYLSGRGNLVILEGLKGIESQIDRTEGYEQRLAMYPGIHVVEMQTANWTRAMLLVKEGRLKGTVYHDVAGQAERAIMYAISLAKGLDVLSEPVPFFSVDIDNVDYYIDLEEYNR